MSEYEHIREYSKGVFLKDDNALSAFDRESM